MRPSAVGGDGRLRVGACLSLTGRFAPFGRQAAHGLRVWAELDAGTVKLGEGVVICPGSLVTTNVEIGAHAQINVSCTVMHDCRVGAFSTLSPGVHLSGNNVLEPSVFVGTGAVTVHGLPERPLEIGRGAVIGAGAVVTRNVAAGATVVGVPAREVRHPSG